MSRAEVNKPRFSHLNGTVHMKPVRELDLNMKTEDVSNMERPGRLTWEMEPPWMKEGLSVGLLVGMSGGGEGMLGGRLCLLNGRRTPSFMLCTSWVGLGWRTGREMNRNSD